MVRLRAGIVSVAVGLAIFMAAPGFSATRLADEAPDLTSTAGVREFVASLGVDPDRAIYQTGLRNYAGPDCPGAGWVCTGIDGPVVQVATPGGLNFVDCASTCFAVQITQSDGDNQAQCNRDTTESPSATQECTITQSSEGGDNQSQVQMNIKQDQGQIQTAQQTAKITQTSETGDNQAQVQQTIDQVARAEAGAGASTVQRQTAYQTAIVQQKTASGDNQSQIQQTETQNAAAKGGATIEQEQNAFDDSRTGECGEVDPVTGSSTQRWNVCAVMSQNEHPAASFTGQNQSDLDQSINQYANAEDAPVIEQTQGSPDGGEYGEVHQHSTGVSTSTNDQKEVQNLDAKVLEPGALFQEQFGPIKCCLVLTQLNNPNNSFGIIQLSEQFASDSNAFQETRLTGNCLTSGTCRVEQKVVQDGNTFENTCEGSFCDEEIICVRGGEGSGCFRTEPPIDID